MTVALASLEQLLPAFKGPVPPSNESAVRYLDAATEVVTEHLVSLGVHVTPTTQVKAAWTEAVIITAVQLWSRWQGAVRQPNGGGDGDPGTSYGRGFSYPTAARELVEFSVRGASGSPPPAGSFPVPPAYPETRGCPSGGWFGYPGGVGYPGG